MASSLARVRFEITEEFLVFRWLTIFDSLFSDARFIPTSTQRRLRLNKVGEEFSVKFMQSGQKEAEFSRTAPFANDGEFWMGSGREGGEDPLMQHQKAKHLSSAVTAITASGMGTHVLLVHKENVTK
ncbi:hypothetical protein HS088_TW09G00410 [Tripterygium wilfordii]|uniref:Uncharacterized protein n=1 Tax=Tripterygium wilfordii TaxID=458696 RepID=A0A7J7D7L6_TRIWF|nr:hypothetical protein HS088_TW09G00410 [Tripterygium wilfordii]